MERLQLYKEIIYDTNCIVYQCFKTTIIGKRGNFEIESKPFTEITRSLTIYISQEHKQILTLKQAMEEIKKRTVTIIVRKETNRKEVRENYGLLELETFPEDIEIRMMQRLLKKINSFVGRNVYVENNYRPSIQDIKQLKKFYAEEVPNNPALKEKCKPNSGLSYVDEDLILFSKDKIAPLITNDSEIYNFSNELEQRNLCFKIFSLIGFNPS